MSHHCQLDWQKTYSLFYGAIHIFLKMIILRNNELFLKIFDKKIVKIFHQKRYKLTDNKDKY